MCTIGRTKLIISCLSIVTLVVQAYSLITTGVTENGMAKADVGGENDTDNSQTVERRCGLYPNYYQAMRVINTIDTIITLVIPIVLIVSMNALIIHSLFKSSRSFEINEDKHQYPSTASSVKSNRSSEADDGDKQQQPSTSLTPQNEIQVSITIIFISFCCQPTVYKYNIYHKLLLLSCNMMFCAVPFLKS